VEDVEGERRDLTVRYGADTANRVVNACLYGKQTLRQRETHTHAHTRTRPSRHEHTQARAPGR
jgi:hypothetical protein